MVVLLVFPNCSFGLRTTRGVLLHGPTGTGKTSLAQLCTHDAGVKFFPINGPEIVTQYYGESEQALHKAFDSAIEAAPAVVRFFVKNIVFLLFPSIVFELNNVSTSYISHEVVEVLHYSFRPLAVTLIMWNTAIMHVRSGHFLIVISLFTFVIQLMHLRRDPFLKTFWRNISNMVCGAADLWSQ